MATTGRSNYWYTLTNVFFTFSEANQAPSVHVLDWKCDICDSAFDRKYDLEKHISSNHAGKKNYVLEGKVKSPPIKCNLCSAKFMSKNSLSYHIQAVHEGKKPFKCEKCNAAFTSKQGMIGHIAAVHEGKKPHHCAICLTDFSKKSNLKG